ncbi:MAG: magnesium transporter CorA family protein [Oscillospiraceae bacterium]|nr:magnesium transporter CorA family protein [Oscillospiraceae bacterium]
MINYYKTINRKIIKQEECTSGCWVNCMAPSERDISFLTAEFKIDPDFLRAALDEEETSRIDSENGVILMVIDSPVVEKSEKNLIYYTMPLSIFITEKNIITISLKNNEMDGALKGEFARSTDTANKTNFILNMILFLAGKYLKHLGQLTRVSDRAERTLRKSMKNKELIQLLEIKKSLVYFSSSLKNIKITVEKIARGRFVKFCEEDRDLLDDAIIEINQAIEMTDTHLSITDSTMEAFASIISNNLNILMKVLASLTLIISIPTVVSGIYGMNTPNFPMMKYWWFPLALSLALMYVAYRILKYKDMI